MSRHCSQLGRKPPHRNQGFHLPAIRGARLLPAPRIWLSLKGLPCFPKSKPGKKKARSGERAASSRQTTTWDKSSWWLNTAQFHTRFPHWPAALHQPNLIFFTQSKLPVGWKDNYKTNPQFITEKGISRLPYVSRYILLSTLPHRHLGFMFTARVRQVSPAAKDTSKKVQSVPNRRT